MLSDHPSEPKPASQIVNDLIGFEDPAFGNLSSRYKEEIPPLDAEIERKLLTLISRSPSIDLKKAALSSLIFSNSKVEVLEQGLDKFLSSNKEELRNFAIEVSKIVWRELNPSFKQKVMDLLKPDLVIKDVTRTEATLKKLIGICSAEVKEQIVELTKHANLALRIAAARVLVSSKANVSVWPVLKELALNSPDWQVRNVVLAQLAKDSQLEALEILTQSAKTEQLWANQLSIAQQLINGYGERGAEAFIELSMRIDADCRAEYFMQVVKLDNFNSATIESEIIQYAISQRILGNYDENKDLYEGLVSIVNSIKLASSLWNQKQTNTEANFPMQNQTVEIAEWFYSWMTKTNKKVVELCEHSLEAAEFLAERYGKRLNIETDIKQRGSLIEELGKLKCDGACKAMLEFCERRLEEFRLLKSIDGIFTESFSDLAQAIHQLKLRAEPYVSERLLPFLEIKAYRQSIGTVILANMRNLELNPARLEIIEQLIRTKAFSMYFPDEFRGLKLHFCPEHYRLLKLLVDNLQDPDSSIRNGALKLLQGVEPEWFRSGILIEILNAHKERNFEYGSNYIFRNYGNLNGLFEDWLIKQFREQKKVRSVVLEHNLAKDLAEIQISNHTYSALKALLRERNYSALSVEDVLIVISKQKLSEDLFEIVSSIVSNKSILVRYRELAMIILYNAINETYVELDRRHTDASHKTKELLDKIQDFVTDIILKENDLAIWQEANKIYRADWEALHEMQEVLSKADESTAVRIIKLYCGLLRSDRLRAEEFFKGRDFNATFQYLFEKFPSESLRRELMKLGARHLYLGKGNLADPIIGNPKMAANREDFFAELSKYVADCISDLEDIPGVQEKNSRYKAIDELEFSLKSTRINLSYILCEEISWLTSMFFSKDLKLRDPAVRIMLKFLERGVHWEEV